MGLLHVLLGMNGIQEAFFFRSKLVYRPNDAGLGYELFPANADAAFETCIWAMTTKATAAINQLGPRLCLEPSPTSRMVDSGGS